jgi:hypothetical protein
VNRLLAIAALLVAICCAGCGAHNNPALDRPAPAQRQAAAAVHPVFTPGEGWQTKLASAGDSPVAWAANVDFSGSDADRDFPRDTIDALPNGGIVLVAVGPRAFEGAADFRHLGLPLSLADGRLVTGSYEGQPAPGLSYFYADQRFDDHAVLNVWGYLGGNPPSAALRAEADRALGTLSFEG